MTAFERQQFITSVNQLAAGRRRTLEEAELRALLGLLDDIPWARLEPAIEWSARNDRWFPDAVAIRRAVGAAREAQAQTDADPSAIAAIFNGEVHCRACDDTGFVTEFRRSPLAGTVEREDATRAYATPCPCRATNPLYRAKRARERRWTAAKEEA